MRCIWMCTTIHDDDDERVVVTVNVKRNKNKSNDTINYSICLYFPTLLYACWSNVCFDCGNVKNKQRQQIYNHSKKASTIHTYKHKHTNVYMCFFFRFFFLTSAKLNNTMFCQLLPFL